MTLLERLRECVPDDRELEFVLSQASSGAVRSLPGGRVEYCLPGPKPMVYATAKFGGGRITQLVPGTPLSERVAQDALVARARDDAAAVHGTVAVHRVLFADRKLKGSYEWRDKFRIYPCLEVAPIGAGLNWFESSGGESPEGPPFPFMLQVSIDQSPNPFIQANRTLRELDAYQRLLTLLVSGHIRSTDRPGERVWVSIYRDSRFENHLLYQGFALGDEPQISRTPAPVFAGDDFYNHLWGADPEILLPPALDADLGMFKSLDRNAAQAFLRATYWYSLGVLNRSESALSTVAFSTAIECLLPRDSRPRCSSCGTETGAGPTQMFKRHLARYGTLPEGLHAQRAALYGVRSSLVHGTFAPSVDTDRFSQVGSTWTHDLLLELVTRKSLLKWLRDPQRKTWHREPILPPDLNEHDDYTDPAASPLRGSGAGESFPALTETHTPRTPP